MFVVDCDCLCMVLVGNGLFCIGGVGYEIFDLLLGFGMML